MTINPYRASQCEIYVGDSRTKADLIGSLDGSLVLTGAVETDRRRVIGAGGTIGLTADGVSCGFSATLALRYTEESKKLLTLVDGIMMIVRRDANYGYGFPCVVSAIPITSAAGGIVGINATFTQSVGGNAVSGALRTSTAALGSGQEGYATTSNGISRSASGNLTVSNGQVGVAGTPIVAEA